jgi:hypothetical protein
MAREERPQMTGIGRHGCKRYLAGELRLGGPNNNNKYIYTKYKVHNCNIQVIYK